MDSKSTWMVKTHGDTLNTVRNLLSTIWQTAALQGMVVPVNQNGGSKVVPEFVTDPSQLVQANPCWPQVNQLALKYVVELANSHPQQRLGVVLRPCEADALAIIQQRDRLILDNWLKIGVDCLGSFPNQDIDWRFEKAGSYENLTRQELSHVRQGGISVDRYRQACQICSHPQGADTDLCICLIGLPVKEFLLVTAKNKSIEERLKLAKITDGPANSSIISEHERIMSLMSERRLRTRQRMAMELEPELPRTLDDLAKFFADCTPCHSCFDACPTYVGQLERVIARPSSSNTVLWDWVNSCVVCGMCDEACPEHKPLTMIISQIGYQLKRSPVFLEMT